MFSFAIRTVERHRLFLMADVHFEGAQDPLRVTVRNLSAAGMMVERDRRVKRGQRVTVELRNIGRVAGVVVWARNPIFGIAFHEEIDHELAHTRVPGGPSAVPAYICPDLSDGPSHHWAGKVRRV